LHPPCFVEDVVAQYGWVVSESHAGVGVDPAGQPLDVLLQQHKHLCIPVRQRTAYKLDEAFQPLLCSGLYDGNPDMAAAELA
jgi:hypothetical protein